ncbi:uncharacterized protein [Argopecten irradians]|uniref:uncharacterized protein n=1 Tax=Argopecten irradians TaxID=31199 RepID=UPI003715CD0E
MGERMRKPLDLQSQIFKVKPSRRWTETVQWIKGCLTEYRYDISHQKICSLQDSMNLEKTFQDALSEYEVEVVCVTTHEGDTLDYLKRKSSTNTNIVACIHLDVENKDGTLRVPKQNRRLLGEKYPCETIIKIQEANCVMEQHVAANFSEFQPLAETNQRREMITNWLKKYEEALKAIISECKSESKIKQVVGNLTDDILNSTTQVNMDFSKECQNENVMTFKSLLQRELPDKALCEKVMQVISEMISYILVNIERFKQDFFFIKNRYIREIFDSITRIIIRRCRHFETECIEVTNWLRSIFKKKDEELKEALNQSLQSLHGYFRCALEEERNSKLFRIFNLRLQKLPHQNIVSESFQNFVFVCR